MDTLTSMTAVLQLQLIFASLNLLYDGIVAHLPKIGEVPYLKALADIMNAEYPRNEHGAILKLTMDQISNYFDTVEGEDR